MAAGDTSQAVTADSAKIEQDTLWLYGTVKSHWRALMDKDGLGCETSFYWGSTEDGVKDHVVTADVEIDTLINGSLRLNAKGFVPVSDLQGMDAIWYQAHAKHVWGEGEKDSDKKSKTLP